MTAFGETHKVRRREDVKRCSAALLLAVFMLTGLLNHSPLQEGVLGTRASSTGVVWRTSLWPMPEGDLQTEDFGRSVAVGDVNGDGFDDVIVCSDFGVRVYEGPLPAQDGWAWADPMLEIDVHSYGIYERDVAVADVNNDNIMDIIIGFARIADVYSYNGWVGAFYGRTEWTTFWPPLELNFWDDSDWYTGSPSNSPAGSGGGKFGSSVANAGDVNADGIDDIIVGAPVEEGKGKAYVYYGSTTGLPADKEPDGIIPPYGEWWVEQNGIRYRVEGGLGTEVAKDGHFILPPYTSDNFIIGIPGADIDFDDDGYYEPGETDVGVALLGPRWWCLSGDSKYGATFGYSLGNAGDVNGDGHPEVLICARHWSTAPQPKVFLYLGDSDRVDTTKYDWSVEGIPYANAINAGNKYHIPPVGSAGDINGDIYGDIFIGDPSYNPDATLGRDGRVHIWFGGPPSAEDPSGLGQNEGPETADLILDPSDITKSYVPNMCTSFGHSVASGDINGDGLSDIVVGDPWCYHPYGGTDPGVQSGAVHVFLSGFTPPPLVEVDVTASDPEGNFWVSINTFADKGAAITLWRVVRTINIASYTVEQIDDYTIGIDGQLRDSNLPGQVVLGVDPEGGVLYYYTDVSPTSFDLGLSVGWNLVSFPCLPTDASFSNILGGVGFYQVLTWDGTSYVTATAAEAGRGYWILVLQDTTVTIPCDNAVESYELDLPAGWSMIGSIMHAQPVEVDLVFPGWYQLLTWDGTSYVSATTIEPGKGYWVLVLEPTYITVA